MNTVPVPTSKAVRDLFTGLLGRQVEIALRDVADPRLDPQCSVGVYRDDAKNTVSAVTADLPCRPTSRRRWR